MEVLDSDANEVSQQDPVMQKSHVCAPIACKGVSRRMHALRLASFVQPTSMPMARVLASASWRGMASSPPDSDIAARKRPFDCGLTYLNETAPEDSCRSSHD